MPTDPVVDIPFGTALKLSLDHFYDILKTNVGGLGAEERLQLKAVADPVAISDKTGDPIKDEGFKWHSYYNLLVRSDLEIEPEPVSDKVFIGATKFSTVYGEFLRQLRSYVVISELSADDQLKIADHDKEIERLRQRSFELYLLDREGWIRYADIFGYEYGDNTQYIQWSNQFGYRREIEQLVRATQEEVFRKNTILDKQYKEPKDREIVEAEFAYDNPLQRLRYPFFPDYEYDNAASFSATYLALLPTGSTALFDDRRALNWQVPLSDILTTTSGAISGTLDSSKSESKSISTDWSAGGSVSYGFISARASASEATKIKEDFSKAQSVTLASEAAFRANILYPAWFNADLFKNPRVEQNISDFERFLGPKGSLRFYPTALVLIRGFSVEFESSQNWTYDYERKFKASAGGGFRAFGIGFGASASYGKHVKEHKFSQSGTKLKVSDGTDTLRFMGFALKENKIYDETIGKSAAKLNIA